MPPTPTTVGAAASVPPSTPANANLIIYTNHLPHWRHASSTYFITWRLAAHQSDLLPVERDLIQRAVTHFKDERYALFAHVVMNDHVHVLMEPLKAYALESILHSWKSYSANQLQRLHQRDSSVWQKDYFDRIVRNEAEFRETLRYIMNNPAKRWPGVIGYPWVFPGGTEAAPPNG